MNSLVAIVQSVRRDEAANRNRLDHLVRVIPRMEVKLDSVLELLGVIISDQEHLDADVAALVEAAKAIGAEIEALKSQPAAAAIDFTGLDSVVASFQGLVDSPAAPTE